MSPLFIVAVSVLVIAQLKLPKGLGFLPLIVAGCQLGNVEILPELTTARILIVLGLGRAFVGGFLMSAPKSKLDRLFILFSFLAIFSSVGHTADPWNSSPFSARVGLVLNILGTYFYGRVYLSDLEAFRRYAFLLPMVLIPLAICMTIEQRTEKNLYYTLGSRSESAMQREDKIRAKGPFRHPILAGTAGATALPFVYLLWHLGRRRQAMVGLAACLGIVLACASSGPLAAVAVATGAVVMWRWRTHLLKLFWAGVAFALFFVIYSGRGPWHLMASIDLVGGSTGWHRAKLIDSGFEHIRDWWLWGTDYTRDWMATGVSWNPNMVDITNYYLHLGVIGGIPLSLCLVAILYAGYKLLTERMAELRAVSHPDEIVLWCAGASLATHAISFVSISYFDQMYIYFYILLGALPGLVASSSSPLQTTMVFTEQVLEAVPNRPLRYYS